MHFIVLIILVIVVVLIYFKENFIQQYDMILRDSIDPIYYNYLGRIKDTKGYDYFDHKLKDKVFTDVYHF